MSEQLLILPEDPSIRCVFLQSPDEIGMQDRVAAALQGNPEIISTLLRGEHASNWLGAINTSPLGRIGTHYLGALSVDESERVSLILPKENAYPISVENENVLWRLVGADYRVLGKAVNSIFFAPEERRLAS